MFELTQTFTNQHGGSITPIRFKDQIIFLCQEVGPVLDYADLAHSIKTSPGMREGKEYITLDGDNLRQLKELLNKRSATDAVKIAPNVNTLRVLTKPGLQKLMLKSDKPECIAFSDWIVYEVLPQIEATGEYKPQLTVAQKIRRFYQKVQDTRDREGSKIKELGKYLKGATDYSTTNRETRNAFATLQNLVHMVVTGKTAQEIRMERADANRLHCGLLSNYSYTFKGNLAAEPTKTATNFLLPNEIEMESRVVLMILDKMTFLTGRENRLYTMAEFLSVCFDCAEWLAGVREEEIKRKKHKPAETIDKSVNARVRRYNGNRTLCDMGREDYLLEERKQLTGV